MKERLKNPLVWLHGLIGAFINGGAAALGAGGGVMAVDPSTFNLENPTKLLKVMFASFLFAGLTGVWTYLKQSPLPPIELVDDNEKPTTPPTNP